MRRFQTFGIVVAALLLCACTQQPNGSGSTTGTAPAGGTGLRGTLRVAIPQDMKSLNPLLASNSIDGFVWRLMFEPLVTADATGKPFPMLVSQVPTQENGGISRDGLTITYKLRPNMQWTDGKPITSQDVKATWRAIMNPNNNVITKHGYDVVSAIDTPNALTAVVHLKKPFAPFVNTFFGESDQPYAVLPAHVLATAATINQMPFNNAPTVSDGPFKFEKWIHGDRVVLTANDKFFMGKPKLDGIDILIVANENTGATMLRTGAIHFMLEPSITTYPQLANIPNTKIIMNPMNGYEGLGFNTKRAPMSDPRFRLAVAYAIDKARLVKDLTYGQEKVATEDLPDWMWANNPALKPLPRDVTKAKQLLAQAGVKTPLSLVLVTDSANVTHKREAVLIQSMLRDIGIDLEVKTYPGDLLYASQAANGILTNFNFDLTLWPWYGGLDPDNTSEFACSTIPPNGWNVSAYCNKELDAQEAVAMSHYDNAARQAAYHRIEALLARDNPGIFFWWQRQQEAIRTNFQGFAPNPVNESWNAWEWSLSS